MPRNTAACRSTRPTATATTASAPGSEIVTHVPGLDPGRLRRPAPCRSPTSRARYDADAADRRDQRGHAQRHLIWSELDANATDPANVNLLIRPAVNFDEGDRYIVALRRLKDANGDTIRAAAVPALPRRHRRRDPAIEARRAAHGGDPQTLRQSGHRRKDLYLAWDFTVASERNLSERMLHIRDDAFAQLGDTNLGDLRCRAPRPSSR